MRDYERGARSQLRRFRRASLLAVALTAMILLLWGVPELGAQEEAAPAPAQSADAPAIEVPDDPGRAVEEATTTIRELLLGFYSLLPKILIALVLLLLAWFLSAVTRRLVHLTLGGWEKREAISAMLRITIYLVAIGAALSVIAGDARALVGSVGLAGLALSWALQTPIESFTGWVLNSFQSYYRVGDRIEVGDVFGDVYKIDVLTTTVWEAGGPGKSVAGAQLTGAMITFPNWEVLRSNIVNYSREFPYVWDEVTIGVANESDLAYTMAVFERTARELFGSSMIQPAEEYRRLLEQARLTFDVAEQPQVFVSQAESWTNCTVRYLVPARERRRWSSALVLALSQEMAKEEHAGKIVDGYPRTEVQLWQGEEVPSKSLRRPR